ncbi:MAG: MarR family transcriptional regulator [Clostridia bacterium]|nr:MarR family transcriptional regulator [Clostridia bacterium]
MGKYDALKLENQLCFPLYAAGKEIVKKYVPVLDKLGLTYTQYIAMMVLWQGDGISVKELGSKLFLDSGTLTPLLKSMEKKGFVKRQRSEADERVVSIYLTEEGRELREKALCVPEAVGKCVKLSPDEAMQLYTLLYKLLGNLSE